MKVVPLGGRKAEGRVAMVDDGDFEPVTRYSWHVWERTGNGPYAQANIWKDGKRTTMRMHVLISGSPLTDHRDHDGLNNQRANLRVATTGQNAANSRPWSSSTSAYKGVGWQRSARRWRARIHAGGTSRFLGLFESEADAARAYDSAAREAFGAFACLNFPEAEHDGMPCGVAQNDAGESGPERKRTR